MTTIKTIPNTEILQKIIAGKLAKFTKEITLVNQAFVKDPEVKIADLLNKNHVLKVTRS